MIPTPSTTPAPAPSHRIYRTNTLASNRMLDDYRIDSILGAGGFGVTYKAWDTHLASAVAIKEYFPVEWSFRDSDGVTVHPNTQGSQVNDQKEPVSDYLWGLERFLEEARILAQIQHPCIVRVKRYFRAHGTAYIVMDYEEGEPLNALLPDDQTLPETELRVLLTDVLSALQAVHEQGFLHRDIKPSNLYIRTRDQRVILLDFGSARQAAGRHGRSMTSMVTPGYSPPEQYTTRNDRYGPWTDLYALGAVLYRCVTGRPPMEAAERLLEDQMEPTLRVCAGRYSAQLLQVIDRAMAVRSEQRFQSVAEMQAALNAPLDEDDDTLIVNSLVKPGHRPIQEGDLAPPDQVLAMSTAAPMTNRNRLEITQPGAVSGQPNDRRLAVLPAPPESDAAQRQWLPSLVGGMALTAMLAAVGVWLWPAAPTPERNSSPPRLDRQEPSTTTSDAHPSITAGAPTPVTTPEPASPTPAADTTNAVTSSAPVAAPSQPVGSTVPPPLPTTLSPPPQEPSLVETAPVAPPVTLEPPAAPVPSTGASAEPAPPPTSRETTAQPGPVRTPVSRSAPKTAVAVPALPASSAGAPAAPAKPRESSTTRAAAAGPSVAKAPPRPALTASNQPKPTSRKTGKTRRRSRSQPIAPDTSVRDKTPAPTTTVHNPWESPTSTGFNQK